jgi:hypothetical protein
MHPNIYLMLLLAIMKSIMLSIESARKKARSLVRFLIYSTYIVYRSFVEHLLRCEYWPRKTMEESEPWWTLIFPGFCKAPSPSQQSEPQEPHDDASTQSNESSSNSLLANRSEADISIPSPPPTPPPDIRFDPQDLRHTGGEPANDYLLGF